jgi:phosphatidylglycerol:prolipoprotein diacylglycerol transferase
MMATGLFVAYHLLRVDLRRRHMQASALTMIVAIAIAGLVYSRMYHALLNLSSYLKDPVQFFSPFGHTFYGAVIGGVLAVIGLAMYYRIPPLSMLDAIAPEAAIGYGIGRIGCFLAGDGDYGIATSLPWGMSFPHGVVPTAVRVHPTPLYEFAAAVLLTVYLWRLGREQLTPSGYVFGQYLIWSGLARFLVEFIRRNDKVFWGLTNAQIIALLSTLSGMLLVTVRSLQSRRGAVNS